MQVNTIDQKIFCLKSILSVTFFVKLLKLHGGPPTKIN